MTQQMQDRRNVAINRAVREMDEHLHPQLYELSDTGKQLIVQIMARNITLYNAVHSHTATRVRLNPPSNLEKLTNSPEPYCVMVAYVEHTATFVEVPEFLHWVAQAAKPAREVRPGVFDDLGPAMEPTLVRQLWEQSGYPVPMADLDHVRGSHD